jgi:hypothetical protein
MQVGRVFPELRANVTYLWENRRLWMEAHLADVDADAARTPAERAADRVGRPQSHSAPSRGYLAMYLPECLSACPLGLDRAFSSYTELRRACHWQQPDRPARNTS